MFLGYPQFGQPGRSPRSGDRRDPGRDGSGSGNDRVPESPSRPDIPDSEPPGVGTPQPYIDINARGEPRTCSPTGPRRSRNPRIPATALTAYGNAAEIQRQQHPECGIGWTTLAGIAAVENKHGRHRGARIAADGDTSPHIRGSRSTGRARKPEDHRHRRRKARQRRDLRQGRWVRFSSSRDLAALRRRRERRREGEPRQPRRRGAVGGRYLCVSAHGDMTTPKAGSARSASTTTPGSTCSTSATTRTPTRSTWRY